MFTVRQPVLPIERDFCTTLLRTRVFFLSRAPPRLRFLSGKESFVDVVSGLTDGMRMFSRISLLSLLSLLSPLLSPLSSLSSLSPVLLSSSGFLVKRCARACRHALCVAV